MCSPSEGTDIPGNAEFSNQFIDEQYVNERENCSYLHMDSSPPETLFYYAPQWSDVPSNVRWVLLLHNYGFACMFFFLAFYAFFSILNLRSQLSTRPYMSTINSFLCLLGISRAAGLFIDPYGLMKTMPVLLGALLWDLGFPSLISSFSLIQIAFLQLTQLDLEPEKLRKKTCLSIIITVHFVTVLATAIYSNIREDMLAKFVSQLIFAIWGLLLCGSFLYAGKQVLGIISGHGGTNPSADGSSLASGSEKGQGLAGLGMGLLAPGQNIAASLTAALAPTLLQSSTPKIKITDENDRTVSVASDSSRLNDNDPTGGATSSGFQLPSTSNGRPSTPVPSTSKSIPGTSSANASNTPSDFVRPPSPVLPRRKSAGSTQLRTLTGATVVTSAGNRKISFNNRRGSGLDEKDGSRKKSLTWSENEIVNSTGGKKSVHIKTTPTSITDNNLSDGGKRRQSRKSMDNSAEGSINPSSGGADRNGGNGTGPESLLSSGGPDYTLQSILSHIAYVNQTALDYRLSRKLSRKNQVHKIIKFTSITAILGVLLCIAEMIRIISPYGLLASSTAPPGLWPWFLLQTVSRTIEFAMGATVANITKQPVNRPHHYAYSFRHKGHRESLYL